ncbi:MAG: PKD domain-containing protein, partial [Bacteroidetes bacterium OLB11]
MCEGSTNTYSVTPIPEATSYTWTLPNGWTGMSTTNTITATASVNSGNITCQANYLCGSSAAVSLAVTVNPNPILSINANPGAICSGSSSSLTANGASTYVWNPGALVGNPVNVSPTITTTYTVVGTDGNSCSNSTVINIHVDHTLTGVGTSSPSTICLGESSTINGSATNLCFGNINDFNGDYAPVNWTMTQNNSNGTVNTTNAPSSITIISSNNLSGTPGYVTYSIPISCNGNVTFNWNYTHLDPIGSIFDYPEYTINGGSPTVFPGFIIGGSNAQNGNATIPVNAGDVFAFRMYSIDNDITSGFCNISSFTAPAPAATGTVSVWDVAIGGNNLGIPPQIVTPATPGIVNYYLEVTSGVCVNPIRVAVPITVNSSPTVTASITPATTCNQTSATPTAGATGGLAPYTFAWSGGLTDNTPFVANANGTYTATATDANGCSATSTAALTVTAASGIIAPVTSNHSQDHGDDFDINYYDASCDLIATVDDGMGGNVLGLTTATVNVEATAGVHNGQPFVRRWYQITPTSNGSADVILYINQSDFDDYNTVVAAPYLALPTGPADVTGIANIRITKND